MSIHDFCNKINWDVHKTQVEFMRSRIHSMERMETFPGMIEMKNVVQAIDILKSRPFCILGAIEIKAQTNFGDLFPEPHPRLALEALLFWAKDPASINFGIKLRLSQFARPNVRYCIETYVSSDSFENAKLVSLGYFGSQAQLILMEGTPIVLWSWVLDVDTLNLSMTNGKPIGNLKDLLNKKTLRVYVNFHSMSAMNIMNRVGKDERIFNTRPRYVELLGDRNLSISTMLYQEFSQYYDLRIHSIDRKSYFLIDSCRLTQYSKSLYDSFRKHYELDHRGTQICTLEVDLVTTDALRILLFWANHMEAYAGWTEFGNEVLLGAIHLGLTEAVRFFVKDLKKNYLKAPSEMTYIWMNVLEYYKSLKPQVEAYRKSVHERLHPGLPCGSFCK